MKKLLWAFALIAIVAIGFSFYYFKAVSVVVPDGFVGLIELTSPIENSDSSRDGMWDTFAPDEHMRYSLPTKQHGDPLLFRIVFETDGIVPERTYGTGPPAHVNWYSAGGSVSHVDGIDADGKWFGRNYSTDRYFIGSEAQHDLFNKINEDNESKVLDGVWRSSAKATVTNDDKLIMPPLAFSYEFQTDDAGWITILYDYGKATAYRTADGYWMLRAYWKFDELWVYYPDGSYRLFAKYVNGKFEIPGTGGQADWKFEMSKLTTEPKDSPFVKKREPHNYDIELLDPSTWPEEPESTEGE